MHQKKRCLHRISIILLQRKVLICGVIYILAQNNIVRGVMEMHLLAIYIQESVKLSRATIGDLVSEA